MATMTREKYGVLLDVTRGATSGTYKWVPVDLSTTYELAWNPNTETYSFICYKNDTQEVTSYAPSMSQETVLDTENPMYEFMDEYANEFPIRQNAKMPVLLVRPDLTTGAPTNALLFADAVVVPNTLNSVDGKLSFDIYLNGTPVEGTVNGIYEDTVTFSPKE